VYSPDPPKSSEYEDPSSWNDAVRNAFDTDSAQALTIDTVWPRDTMFKYLSLMSVLQENSKEYQELQLLTGT
jgi:cation channel sperm-associated protein 2